MRLCLEKSVELVVSIFEAVLELNLLFNEVRIV